ncbi:hypothetical protein HKX48_007960 [Thoreauomyces humboldtii]|nr:hypothetical protein HKX48_007960 [Thoreauomyces humboldtii]
MPTADLLDYLREGAPFAAYIQYQIHAPAYTGPLSVTLIVMAIDILLLRKPFSAQHLALVIGALVPIVGSIYPNFRWTATARREDNEERIHFTISGNFSNRWIPLFLFLPAIFVFGSSCFYAGVYVARRKGGEAILRVPTAATRFKGDARLRWLTTQALPVLIVLVSAYQVWKVMDAERRERLREEQERRTV